MNRSDGPRWRKSTFSGANGGGCVEVAGHDGMILVRDTKNHGRGPICRYTPDEWRAFIAGVRSGEFSPSVARGDIRLYVCGSAGASVTRVGGGA